MPGLPNSDRGDAADIEKVVTLGLGIRCVALDGGIDILRVLAPCSEGREIAFFCVLGEFVSASGMPAPAAGEGDICQGPVDTHDGWHCVQAINDGPDISRSRFLVSMRQTDKNPATQTENRNTVGLLLLFSGKLL